MAVVCVHRAKKAPAPANTRGTQFFDHDSDVLTLPSGGLPVTLAASIYNAAGTYALFKWPTTVNLAGGTSDLSKITLTPPGGRVLIQLPFIDSAYPGEIRFTLS